MNYFLPKLLVTYGRWLALTTYMLLVGLCYKAFPRTFAKFTQKWEVRCGVQNLNGMQFTESILLN